MALLLDAGEIETLLDEVFPQVRGDFQIEALSAESVRVRLKVQDRHLRPGGTVSGPAMFGLADVTMYTMVLARIGPEALAVTTNCAIDFMRKPVAQTDMIATCRLLKLGKSLAVGEVHMNSEGDDRLVARASLTYSIPPKAAPF